MDTITTTAAPVVRTTDEFGFDGIIAVTFTGRPERGARRQAYTINLPKRGFNRKDGSVSITNRSGNWGWSPNVEGPGYLRVWDFQPVSVIRKDGSVALWQHNG